MTPGCCETACSRTLQRGTAHRCGLGSARLYLQAAAIARNSRTPSMDARAQGGRISILSCAWACGNASSATGVRARAWHRPCTTDEGLLVDSNSGLQRSVNHDRASARDAQQAPLHKAEPQRSVALNSRERGRHCRLGTRTLAHEAKRPLRRVPNCEARRALNPARKVPTCSRRAELGAFGADRQGLPQLRRRAGVNLCENSDLGPCSSAHAPLSQ